MLLFDRPKSSQKALANFKLIRLSPDSNIKFAAFTFDQHTFATLALTHDIDLNSVPKLLGHKEIKTTQIYAKLIDKKKDEAVDKLPKI